MADGVKKGGDCPPNPSAQAILNGLLWHGLLDGCFCRESFVAPAPFSGEKSWQ